MSPPGDSTQLKQEDVRLQSFPWHLQSTKAHAELFTMFMGKVAYTLEVQGLVRSLCRSWEAYCGRIDDKIKTVLPKVAVFIVFLKTELHF